MARIMVTDDASFMRVMLKALLTEGGHEVVAEASNGQEAIEIYDQHLPDVVTMDITMPQLDGIGAVKAITGKHPDAKIIMCSAMGQQDMVLQAVQAGAKGFIVKPFNQEKLLGEIENIIS